MRKKKTQLTLFIMAILTIAFFGGGNKEVIPLSMEQMEKDAGIVEDTSPSNNDISIETNEKNEDIREIENSKKEESKSQGNLVKESEEESLGLEIDSEKKYIDKKDNDRKADKQKEIKREQTNEVETKEENAKKGKNEKAKIIAQDKKNIDEKDKYLTDPVPEGKPEPVEWQDITINKENTLTATLSVTCKTILNNMHLFNMDKLEVLPEDGIIYATKKVVFYEGESVFDVLLREMQENKIHMEFVMTPIYNSNYIAGINNIYEFDCGELSGWMYRVNGWFPNYGASRYQLQDGDKIEWIYTCDLGRDIGGDWAVTGGEE